MKLYAKAVEPDLPAAALHDAAYALLFDALRADWQVRAVHSRFNDLYSFPF